LEIPFQGGYGNNKEDGEDTRSYYSIKFLSFSGGTTFHSWRDLIILGEKFPSGGETEVQGGITETVRKGAYSIQGGGNRRVPKRLQREGGEKKASNTKIRWGGKVEGKKKKCIRGRENYFLKERHWKGGLKLIKRVCGRRSSR